LGSSDIKKGKIKMKNDELPNLNKPLGVGSAFLKIIETGEIVRWQDFSPATQLFTVASSKGKSFTIEGSKISKDVTPEEELKFINDEKENSN
jgi:hypothetical protein